MNFPDRSPTGNPTTRTRPAQITRPTRTRRWIDGPTGRILLAGGTFLLGIIVTVIISFLVFASLGGESAPVATQAQSGNNAITAQLSKAYISQIVNKEIQTAGLPGTISNVQVKLVHQGPVTVTGDDQISMLGFPVTRQFTLTLQLFVQNCQLQLHVLSADLQGISITSYAAKFESDLNQQLHMQSTSLPQGFTYCLTSVSTEPQGVTGVYSATPTP